MSDSTKDIRIAISRLARQNLVPNAVFKPVVNAYLQVEPHKRDDIITEIIRITNNKYPLSQEELKSFNKDSISFTSRATIIGIQNSKGQTYRIVRAERYKEYTNFCKLMLRNNFNLFVLQKSQFDILFM